MLALALAAAAAAAAAVPLIPHMGQEAVAAAAVQRFHSQGFLATAVVSQQSFPAKGPRQASLPRVPTLGLDRAYRMHSRRELAHTLRDSA